MIDQLRLADLAETMFAADLHGRLTGAAPRLHIVRTPDAVICRCHADLPDDIAAALADIAARPRGRPTDWARDYAGYANTLAPTGPPAKIRSGPLYGFPDALPSGDGAVRIDETNAELLCGGLDDWLPDVAAGTPMMAMVAEGRAVSICASVRASAAAHCAGVETLPDFRGRGLAARAVTGWARRVRASGAGPVYGTTFDNLASQGVARALGLRVFASEFSVD